jgi:hypothetical protein
MISFSMGKRRQSQQCMTDVSCCDNVGSKMARTLDKNNIENGINCKIISQPGGTVVKLHTFVVTETVKEL